MTADRDLAGARGLPFLPAAIFVACAVVAMTSTNNAMLWLAGGGALAIATHLLNAPNSFALLSIIGVYWIGIGSDLLSADVAGVGIETQMGDAYRPFVIKIALLAMVVMAAGAAFGLARWGRKVAPPISSGPALSLRGCLWLYAVTAFGKIALGTLATLIPPLAQPLLGAMKIHYVSIYLVSYCVLRSGKGYLILGGLFLWEALIGMTGYISTFQPVIVTIFVALLATVGRAKAGMNVVRIGVAVVAAIWLASLWTAVKPAYREWMMAGPERTLTDRIDWLVSFAVDGPRETQAASTPADPLVALLARVGYTAFFAVAAQRSDDGVLGDVPPRWQGAIEHVLKPRFLFDKPILDDTVITTALTGITFGAATSVSIGYTAEAYVDFGFPGMLVPMFLLGAALGGTTGYFMSRGMRPELGQGFAVAAVVFTFQFGTNIDKEIGGLLAGIIALVPIQMLAGAQIEAWVSQGSRSRGAVGAPAAGTS